MTPADTYGLFECRGDMQRVKGKKERYYYFYIDKWVKPPRLCFMEHGIRHARMLAFIDAPIDIIDNCIAAQGRSYKKQSFAIDETLSLLGQEKAKHGLHIHPCFTGKQGYVFTADRRKPGGFWFVDLRQARIYWASGTMAGGFARLCRNTRIIFLISL
jgi:hypothetical protein